MMKAMEVQEDVKMAGGFEEERGNGSSPPRIKSSPPLMAQDAAMNMETVPISNGTGSGTAENEGAKSDSEAETIVLPGKDGHSPSKTRRSIKHEDRSEGEGGNEDGNEDEAMEKTPKISSAVAPRDERRESGEWSESGEEKPSPDVPSSNLGKRKRPPNGNGKKVNGHGMGNSSGLSSVPTSPGATRPALSKHRSESELSNSTSPSPHSHLPDKAKSVDRILPRKRSIGSRDDIDSQRFARHRSSGLDPHRHQERIRSVYPSAEGDTTRSTSPLWHHKRSASTQLPAKNSSGLSHKKRRPPPLRSTEYQSDDSSASNRSNLRSSRQRLRAGPGTGDSTTSPVKMAPHKKHVDSSGQTLLARACSSGKFANAKDRLSERPEDLEIYDNAGNYPIHFASINGFEEIVKLLVDNKCDLDVVNNEGDTPLHDAIENGHVEVVRLLLDAGANPRKVNRKGDNPEELLAQNTDTDEADLLMMRQLLEDAKSRRRDAPPASAPTASSNHASHTEFDLTGRGGSRATARSNKTSDSHLYQDYTVDRLRILCSRGDAVEVDNWIATKPGESDPQSLIIAAKGGHASVVGLLLALTKVKADPDPPEERTVEASTFLNSTPMLVAIGRENSIEVIESLLGSESGFDPTRIIKGSTYFDLAKSRAGPMWKEEYDILKNAFDTYQPPPAKFTSPKLLRDAKRDATRSGRSDRDFPSDVRKRSGSRPSDKHSGSKSSQHRSFPSLHHSNDGHEKSRRGPGRPRKEELIHLDVSSDIEPATGIPKRKSQSQPRKSEPDLASSDGEKVKPRRKLVSGKERKEELESRRASVASIQSGAPQKERRDETQGENPARKSSGSMSQDRTQLTKGSKIHDASSDKLAPEKSRTTKRDPSNDRVAAIRNEKSPAKRPRNSITPPRASTMQETTPDVDGAAVKRRKLDSKQARKESTASSSPPERPSTSASTHDKSGKITGNPTSDNRTQSTAKLSRSSEPRARGVGDEKEIKRKKDEDRKADSDRQGTAKREAEESKVRETARKQQEAEDARLKQEEEDRQAQLERDAKQQYDEQEKKKQEQKEQRQAELRAERARLAAKAEQERLDRLPLLLRWFDQHPMPKSPGFAANVAAIEGYRYDTINPQALGQPAGREQWLLNTDVALLLGEKDLQLNRFTAWERVPLSIQTKRDIWRFEKGRYSMASMPSRLAEQMPELKVKFYQRNLLPEQNEDKFVDQNLFFVKLAEFLYVVPNHQHLSKLPIIIGYRELVDWSSGKAVLPENWAKDPGHVSSDLAPARRQYLNGDLVREPPPTILSNGSEFPENRVPRRGTTRVWPHESDYWEIIKADYRLHYLAPKDLDAVTQTASSGPAQLNGITPPLSENPKSINGGSSHQGSVSEADTSRNHAGDGMEVGEPQEGTPAANLI